MAASQSNETYTARRMHLPYHYSAVTDDTCLDVTPAFLTPTRIARTAHQCGPQRRWPRLSACVSVRAKSSEQERRTATAVQPSVLFGAR